MKYTNMRNKPTKMNVKLILHQNATASFNKSLENAAFNLLKAFGVEIS